MPVEQIGPGAGVEQPRRQVFELAELGDRFQGLLLLPGRGLAELVPALV